MVWERSLDLRDNEIIIGFKHPMNYACTLFIGLRQFGQMIVFVPIDKSGFVNGLPKTASQVWDDTSKFLRRANYKINFDDDHNGYKRFLVD